MSAWYLTLSTALIYKAFKRRLYTLETQTGKLEMKTFENPENPENQVEITPEMIKAVKAVIESNEAYVYSDIVLGVEVLEEDAEKIIATALLAGGFSIAPRQTQKLDFPDERILR
jgi:hypothetical protein